jgi:hypothetical protein
VAISVWPATAQTAAVVETHQGVLERHGYVCLELVSTREGTLGFGRITITIGNGQIAPAVPRVALREAEPSSKPIAITGFRQ